MEHETDTLIGAARSEGGEAGADLTGKAFVTICFCSNLWSSELGHEQKEETAKSRSK